MEDSNISEELMCDFEHIEEITDEELCERGLFDLNSDSNSFQDVLEYM